MISQDTRLAIRATWGFYELPFGSDAEDKVLVGLAVLSEAPEADVAKLGTEALQFWKGFRATCQDCYPLLSAARLRAVDNRLRALAEKVQQKEAV